MSDWYDVSGTPATNAALASAAVRNEFALVQTAMAKLPVLAGNGLKIVRVNAAGTAMESISPNSVAGSQLLATYTASASATLDVDASSYTATFDSFEIRLEKIKPATAAADFWLRFGASGVYDTSAYRWARHQVTDLAAEAAAGSASDAKVIMNNAVDNSDGNQVTGIIRVQTLSGLGTRVEWHTSYSTAASLVSASGSGHYAAAARNQFRLMFSAGNITSGKARLYGIRTT